MRERGEGRVYRPVYTNGTTGERKQSAVWWYQFSHRGKRYRKSAETKKKSEALKRLNAALAKAREGTFTDIVADRVTFQQLKKMLLNDYTLNKRRSIKRVEGALAHLEAEFGEDRAIDITGDRVLSYTSHRLEEEKAAGATINRELSALKRMFTLAIRAKKLADSPYIAPLMEDNARQGFFEREELEAVLAHLSKDLQPLFTVAYLTGWRVRSELLTRQWHHVDLNEGWLRLEPGETKNRKGRMLPLFPELKDVLEKQRSRTTAIERATGQIIPWVFHREGCQIKEFRRTWKTACRKAGLPGKIPHDFRRTAVRNLERAGVPKSTAKKMVGHKTDSIYERYAIVDEGMLKESASKLADLHEARLRLSKNIPFPKEKSSQKGQS